MYSRPAHDEEEMKKEPSMLHRLRNFVASLSVCLLFVYVFLPYLTESISILNRMSHYLESNGIDPSRYYYTDVEQVKEAENYLQDVLD